MKSLSIIALSLILPFSAEAVEKFVCSVSHHFTDSDSSQQEFSYFVGGPETQLNIEESFKLRGGEAKFGAFYRAKDGATYVWITYPGNENSLEASGSMTQAIDMWGVFLILNGPAAGAFVPGANNITVQCHIEAIDQPIDGSSPKAR